LSDLYWRESTHVRNAATTTAAKICKFSYATCITVQLLDSSGNVLAAIVTDSQGLYAFTQQSGLASNPDVGSGISATGNYQVALVLPAGMTQTTPNPDPIAIAVGDSNVFGVDFGVM
jgi:hypothetical protein